MRRAAIATLCLGLAMSGCAGLEGESLGDLLEEVGGKRSLDDQTIVAGLRDALRVGTENAVKQTSQTDGFLGNELIRIPLPESFQSAGNVLRKVGFGSQVDELEVAMNRGAETAAGEAGDVFLSAIQDMTIGDARSILEGGDTAATDYFIVVRAEDTAGNEDLNLVEVTATTPDLTAPVFGGATAATTIDKANIQVDWAG